jgi:hypothetical protein
VSGIDWQARARREAVAILANLTVDTSRGALIDLLAVAWLQGVNVGSHETLAAVEVGFEEMRAAL